MITHEHFRERATLERASAAGIRPLAHHVRALYAEIRALRADGVPFKYIATVLIDVRGQSSSDPIEVTEKLRVYHHRDRKMLGDAIPALKPAGRSHSGKDSLKEINTAENPPAATAATPIFAVPAGSDKPCDKGLQDVSRSIQARAARKRLVADDTP